MPISHLYIHEHAAEAPLAAMIRSCLDIPFTVVKDNRQVFERISAADDPATAGKTALFITRNEGSFIRKCPGTRHYNCCGYMILHVGTYCTLDCAYCILQAYFHPPVLQFFVNHEDMMAELDQMFQEKAVRRIGTGEFTDSMIWEAWTDLSGVLVPRFAAQSHAVLELKTKTTAIDRLMGLDHQRKTIAAWSVNTPKIIRECERGASSLAARFRAARQCADRGYPLAFHFDPMIIYKGCEEDYREVVRGIFACALPENIAWISMGAFRFMPALKPIIQKRFPDSDIVYGEFIPGIDNKMRYFKPLRIQLFQKIYAAIKEIAPDVTVYLCMEDDEVWEKAFGFIPSDVGGISEMLDRSAIKICNLKP